MKKSMFVLALAAVLVFASTAIVAAASSLDRIVKKGELVVGTTGTQPPLNAVNRAGEVIGMDADIAKIIAQQMGVEVKFSKMPFAKLLPALEAGKVDMVISSMTMTMERNLKVAFVGPYYVSGKGVLTKASSTDALQQGDGLNTVGYRVAALKDSTSQKFVETSVPRAELVKVRSYDDALDMLFKDQVIAIVADFPYCAFAAFRHRDKDLVAGQSRLTFEPLGIAVQPDPLLINWLRNFLALFEGSGQNKLLTQKWFRNADWIKDLP